MIYINYGVKYYKLVSFFVIVAYSDRNRILNSPSKTYHSPPKKVYDNTVLKQTKLLRMCI